jgi:hypothetical protein
MQKTGSKPAEHKAESKPVAASAPSPAPAGAAAATR